MLNNLKLVRQKRGLPIWALASKAKASVSTISGIERWNYSPGFPVRQRLAEALEVEVNEIWPGSEVEANEELPAAS